jgi:hypothetical protein
MKKKLIFDETPYTEEEEKELDYYFAREGMYWGNDPKIIEEIEREMAEDEEFQKILKEVEKEEK